MNDGIGFRPMIWRDTVNEDWKKERGMSYILNRTKPRKSSVVLEKAFMKRYCKKG